MVESHVDYETNDEFSVETAKVVDEIVEQKCDDEERKGDFENCRG